MEQQKLSTKQKMIQEAFWGLSIGALHTTICAIKPFICDKTEKRRDQIYEAVRDGLAISASYTTSAAVYSLTDDD